MSYENADYGQTANAPQTYAGYAAAPQRPRVNMIQAVKQMFLNYVNFYGRANKGEFWWAILAWAIVYAILFIPYMVTISAAATSGDLGAAGLFGALLGIFALGTLLPLLGLYVRRLHDTGRSGWWYLISLVPFVGSIILLVFLAGDSSPEGPRFDNPDGSQPKIAA